jgi:hypothetical protein
MTEWSLSTLLAGLHNDIQHRLDTVRRSFGHPTTKGNASETVWLELFQTYLPQRYQAASAHVVDSQGQFSDQIDVVIFDRQYSPFIFHYEKQTIVPAESVYAVFETKQTINLEQIQYTRQKIASMRRLQRTSLPIPHAGGTYPPKPLIHIYGGLLTFESDWKPPLGDPLLNALNDCSDLDRIDLGCIAAHGCFQYDPGNNTYNFDRGGKHATAFLFDLISRLQASATVPMIDIQAYAQWLAEPASTR